MATVEQERIAQEPTLGWDRTQPVVERYGTDYIPVSERHGKPWNLATFWGASNVQILAVSIGVLVGSLGLSLEWCIGAILLGNVFGTAYMALHSVQGPRLGLPQMMQSRAQFGMYGLILPNVIILLMYIGYFTSSGILGGEAFHTLIHVTTAEGIMIINACCLVVVWFGYDLLHRYTRFAAFLQAAAFIALLVELVRTLPAHLPSHSDAPGLVLLAVSFVVAWQVTWAPYMSDYSRYLPQDTPGWKTFVYTYIGAGIGGSLMFVLGAVGAQVALGALNTNTPSYLAGLFPAAMWVFLIIFLISVLPGNFGNLYGPFLVFFTIISPSGKLASKTNAWYYRILATTVVAAIGSAIGIAASAHFLADLEDFLVFTLYLLIPWTAINLTDFYIVRRGKYDIGQLYKQNGIYGWVNWWALAIYVITIGIQFPFMNDPVIFVGPAATAMGGADISWIVGFVLCCVMYYFAARYFGTRGIMGRTEIPTELAQSPASVADAGAAPTP
ncbi:MAG: purine-cytosine permease family protein [Acidimicrobiales bacterium]